MSDILMCAYCGKAYKKKFVSKHRICPNIECDGGDNYLFEVDELMMLPVRTLMQKGYLTEYCCSGHVYSEHKRAYIKFCEDCAPDTAPEGWEFDGDNCIRAISDNIFENYKNLMEWCESLVDIDELYGMPVKAEQK